MSEYLSCSLCGSDQHNENGCPKRGVRKLDTSQLGRIAIDHKPDEFRAHMVREALERVARHVCSDTEMGNHMLALAIRCDDATLAALGRMLR